MIWQRKVSLDVGARISYRTVLEVGFFGGGSFFLDENKPSTLLATIAAPGITLAATAASNVDSIDGIACIMNYMRFLDLATLVML